MTTSNTQIVPDQRTRDMGVADTPAAAALNDLRDLLAGQYRGSSYKS